MYVCVCVVCVYEKERKRERERERKRGREKRKRGRVGWAWGDSFVGWFVSWLVRLGDRLTGSIAVCAMCTKAHLVLEEQLVVSLVLTGPVLR